MSTPPIAWARAHQAGAPQLLACHGVTDNAASLSGVLRRWRGVYDVTCLDARGHGLSPRFTPEQLVDPMSTMVDDLIRLLESRRVHEPHAFRTLMGHSMGGAVCAAVAAARPDLVDALIVEDPAWLDAQQEEDYRRGAEAMVERMERIAADPARALAENRRSYPGWEIDEACGWLQGKIQVDRDFLRTGEVAPRGSWRGTASTLSVPTLVLTSDGRDALLGKGGLASVRALGNARLRTVLVPGASHCVRRDQAGGFYRSCEAFLREVVS
ncbi:alpha/beta fold hydrolase [Actinomyces capricornis]|nr:alpha/beta hydrolase [Actinomyces capricornis]